MSNDGDDLKQSSNDVSSINIANLKSEAEKKRQEVSPPPLDEKAGTAMVNELAVAEAKRKDASTAVRNEIAKLTFYFFFPFIFIFIVMMLGVHWFFSSDAKMISEQMTGIVKDMVLPVVTLVLGYFFGSSPER